MIAVSSVASGPPPPTAERSRCSGHGNCHDLQGLYLCSSLDPAQGAIRTKAGKEPGAKIQANQLSSLESGT